MTRLFGTETYARLKAESRDLVQAAGGQERAAMMTVASQSKLSEALSPHHPERFLRIDQMVDLQKDSGHTGLLAYLADLTGHVLVPRGTAPGKPPLRVLADLIAASNEVEQQLAESLVDGAGLSRVEAEALLPLLRTSLERQHELEAQLLATLGRDGSQKQREKWGM